MKKRNRVLAATALLAVVLTGCAQSENQAQYKELLGIPDNQAVVAVLIVGTPDVAPDGESGATQRKSFDEVVTMIRK